MQLGFSQCQQDGLAYKTKWNQHLPDYKKIADYLMRTTRNVSDYWVNMSNNDKKAEGLPKIFAEDVFVAIYD